MPRSRAPERPAWPAAACALALVLALVLALAAAPASAGRDELRHIVQQQCLPNWLMQHDPSPCESIDIPGGEAMLFGAGVRRALAAGYAILADEKGGAHLLLIPLATISGIGSPALLASDAPHYFAAAWAQRTRLAMAAGRALAPDQVALAVNSRYSRSQDQLHIHLECQGPALHAALQAQAGRLSERWTQIEVAGRRYQARRTRGASLEGIHPVALLAAGVPDARADMAAYTLVVAGVRFTDGPGFALLARRASLGGGGEGLLDPSCALARAAPPH
ncbi:MAG TPA: CDP-diacylglycerol diphosphatase [Steroidobacteraceae bacterium]|nr:CDP-diacylglycerol diphosphatase [Steroidobacteraceae bacterium]